MENKDYDLLIDSELGAACKTFLGLGFMALAAFVFAQTYDNRVMHQCLDRGGSYKDDGCNVEKSEKLSAAHDLRRKAEGRVQELEAELRISERELGSCKSRIQRYYSR